jgi:acetyl-CoA carboxylase carboxyl transferase subunit alpha
MEYIPLEQPIAELETKIDELRRLAASQSLNLDREIEELMEKASRLRREMFARLNAYEKVQISRHPRRPNTLELLNNMCSTFVELHGDRNFLDDQAVVGGLAMLEQYPIMAIGHQKGRGTKDNIFRNFGMPRPEGYRKALRMMSMAERFHIPIVTLIDTPGAYPGIGAEERGQSEAIAKNIMVMSRLKVPIITVVIGEGGSGGALALAVANRVHMMEHAVYSVISPEGCASILFKDAAKSPDAAESLKITAQHALEFGVADTIIPEPEGGAHRSIDLTAAAIKTRLLHDLAELTKLSGDELRQQRMDKFMKMGPVKTIEPPTQH